MYNYVYCARELASYHYWRLCYDYYSVLIDSVIKHTYLSTYAFQFILQVKVKEYLQITIRVAHFLVFADLLMQCKLSCFWLYMYFIYFILLFLCWSDSVLSVGSINATAHDIEVKSYKPSPPPTLRDFVNPSVGEKLFDTDNMFEQEWLAGEGWYILIFQTLSVLQASIKMLYYPSQKHYKTTSIVVFMVH